ncbi:MAG: glucose-1-phosphate adenylyltransferase subunit GlgD [Candidatus Krumholzibacteriota bacterium]|nr:glucose-1-phosphate adenylyltransferase subunit GlgD [Candidatus Krumholzibacteriota bacterium]
MKILTMILAGGTGKDLSALTRHRAKTAIPFGGHYRIIDFCLSNCVHSGLSDIFILAQYNPRSLIEHIRMGKPWDLDRKTGGVQILQPVYYGKAAHWYRGTADALYHNRDLLRNSNAELVMVLSGDQVYVMDYRDLINYHIQRDSPVTIAYKKVNPSQHSRFGMVRCSDSGFITEFKEKPPSSPYPYASLGIYLFSRQFLLDILRPGKTDIVFDLIMPLLEEQKVSGFQFDGYWEDIGSIPSYFNASQRLLGHLSMINRPDWPIFTRGENLAPAKFSRWSQVNNSIVADGCVIKGKVTDSILFPGVIIEKEAVVEKSIVFSYSRVGKGARLRRSIIDKQVVIEEAAGLGIKKTRNYRKFDEYRDMDPDLDTGGITIVGKRSRIPRNLNIPAGLVIEPGSRMRM